MNARALLVITALSLVLAASGFALWSNSTFASAVPTCGGHWGPNRTWIAQGWSSSFCQTAVNIRQSGAEVSEGLAVVGILLVLVFAVPRIPALLSRPLRLPETLRVFVLSVFLVLFALYFWTVGFHVSFDISSYVAPPMTDPYALPIITYSAHPSFDRNVGWFLYAYFWSLLFIYGLPKGAFRAFRDSVVFFAAPVVLILEGWVLLFSFRDMPLQATNFATWALALPDAIPLVSNWFVLILVSFLVLWSYTPLLLRKAGIRR